MFGFGKEKMPAPKQETELDELTETTPDVLESLRARARAAAEHLADSEGPIDEQMIKDAAYFVALAAEQRGEPYTLEQLEDDEQISELMERAVKARGELRAIDTKVVFGQNDVQLGTAKTNPEAAELAREVREGQ